jgi:hypothetical protein
VKYIFRKLSTKPIWWWELRRGYAIRSRHQQLPPLPVNKRGLRFVVLTTPETFNDALWTAWSWYRYLRNENCKLEIAVDGVVSTDQSAAAAQLFPGVAIYPAELACRYVCEREPALETFIYGHPTGRKLALILALCDQGPFIYSDHDVLAFNPPHELYAYINGNVACYFPEEVDGARDPVVVARAKDLGLDFIPKFNCGFMYVPGGVLPMKDAADLLATWRPPADSWFSEQTVLSVMMRDVNAVALPSDRYVISVCRQFYWERDVDYKTIAARHFTGPIRHVMFGIGMPWVLRQSRQMVNVQR